MIDDAMVERDDIVERLREQGKDAFARHYSLGMFKLCDEAATEIERLRAALTAALSDPDRVVVPREATDTMVRAALDASAQGYRKIYRVMVNAAPSPNPTAEGGGL